MSRRWSWGPFPTRLCTDPRVMTLPRSDQAPFLKLYGGADEHGFFCADEMALRAVLGFLDGEPVFPSIEAAALRGLVHLYWHGGILYGVIDRYDEDADSKTNSARPKPSHPAPPPEIWKRAGCTGTYRAGKKTETFGPDPESTPWTPGGNAVPTRWEPGGHTVPTPCPPGGNAVGTRWERGGNAVGTESHNHAESLSCPPGGNAVGTRWERGSHPVGTTRPDQTRPDLISGDPTGSSRARDADPVPAEEATPQKPDRPPEPPTPPRMGGVGRSPTQHFDAFQRRHRPFQPTDPPPPPEDPEEKARAKAKAEQLKAEFQAALVAEGEA